MSKTSLQDMMAKRTPLAQRAQRQAVTPARLYTKPEAEETTSPQTDKTTKPLVGKYTTHLRPETIKAIKRMAVERESKDYEVVQHALDAYFDQESK